MDQSNAWTVDRLAANALLAELHIDATEESLALVSKHFARHRKDIASWAAERTHGRMVRVLETEATQSFGHENEQWTEGFRYAEQQLLMMTPIELLDLPSDRPRTRGQILRSMVKQARKS